MTIIYDKKKLLTEKIKHIDITPFNSIPLIESFQHMSFQSRNLADACMIFADHGKTAPIESRIDWIL